MYYACTIHVYDITPCTCIECNDPSLWMLNPIVDGVMFRCVQLCGHALLCNPSTDWIIQGNIQNLFKLRQGYHHYYTRHSYLHCINVCFKSHGWYLSCCISMYCSADCLPKMVFFEYCDRPTLKMLAIAYNAYCKFWIPRTDVALCTINCPTVVLYSLNWKQISSYLYAYLLSILYNNHISVYYNGFILNLD